MEHLTKAEVIAKIKGHIKGCKASKKKYIQEEEYAASLDMKARIDGLELALEYVEKLKAK